MDNDQHMDTSNEGASRDGERPKVPPTPSTDDPERETAPTTPPDIGPSMNSTDGEPPVRDVDVLNAPGDRYDLDIRQSANVVHDREERYVELLERIGERDIRRRQHNRYMLLLDDRIEHVEEELRTLLGRPDLEELKKKDPVVERAEAEKRPYITNIKAMPWKEYANTKGELDKNHDSQYAIDILEEEPAMYQPELRWVKYMKSLMKDKEEEEEEVTEAPKSTEEAALRPDGGPSQTKLMPERIRINCPYLCDALKEFAPEGTFSHPDAKRIVMRRPFKFLMHNEKRLRDFTERKQRALPESSVVDATSTENKRVNSQPAEQNSKDEDRSEIRTVKHLNLLLDFISEHIIPAKERARERISEREKISFHDLHFLFTPGQIVYVKHKEHPQKTWRVLQVTGGNRYLRKYDARDEQENGYKSDKRDSFSPFVLDCYFLAFDGVRFRRVYHRFSVPFFSDEQSTKRFWILPLDIAEKHGLLSQNSIQEQGQQYLECTTICHRYYNGRTLEKDSQGKRLRAREESGVDVQVFSESIDANVMVDFDKAYQQNQHWMLDFEELPEFKVNSREWESSEDPKKETIQGDFVIDSRRKETYLDEEEGSERLETWETKKLRDDDLLVLPDRAPAFVLRSRKWVYVQLGRNSEGNQALTKVQKRTEAWEELQLPGEEDHRPDEENRSSHKYIIQSLVAKHFAKDMNLDLVRNKGRGLIVLLHGAPGVGKTSTAECVAEAEGKPLLPITCGDLGLDPQQVEINLSKHFELAQSWDCILLLDEADVFLAQRSLRDLNRNALVSVFLRILEYYEGILFLTTNKVGLIDEAFKSRIHMALYYPWLTEDQTLSIWRSLLNKAEDSQQGLNFDRSDIMKYARNLFYTQTNAEYGKGPDGMAPGWNGRQIKNGFMSAIALAQFEAKRKGRPDKHEAPIQVNLKSEHFDTVVKASEAFDNYLWKVHNYMADSKIAEKGGFRIDGHGVGVHEPKPGLGVEQRSHPGTYQTRAAPLTRQSSPYQHLGSLQPNQPQYTMAQPGVPYNSQPANYAYQPPSQPQYHPNADPYSMSGHRQTLQSGPQHQPQQQTYGQLPPQQNYQQPQQQPLQQPPQQPSQQQYQPHQPQDFSNQSQQLGRSPQMVQAVPEFDAHGQQLHGLQHPHHNINAPRELTMQAN